MVPPPDFKARQSIFSSQLKDVPLGTITPEFLAENTNLTPKGAYSGADVAQIASEIKKILFRTWLINKEVLPKSAGTSIPLKKRSPVTQEMIDQVMKRFAPGIKTNLLNKYEEWQEINN